MPSRRTTREPGRLMRWLAHDGRRYYATVTVPGAPYVVIAVWMGMSGTLDTRALLLTAMGFWIVWSLLHVAVTYAVFGRRAPEQHSDLVRSSVRRRRALWERVLGLDEGAASFGTQMSVLMLGLMVVVLVTPDLRTDLAVVALAAGTVAACWFMTIVSYAVEYARADHRQRGLEFPGTEPPRFGDYLYFAITVQASFATSDVTVVSTPMRRITATHTIIAFGFNSVILALLITLLTVTVQ
ncbi:DUF1345 domain-containing protein [Georgenia alba]|uniref:DUF1345 domain-containing protein n=1 Tax=Georgenia alba TaxID=2233858 RepID=A0ABW2QB54_9MICO